MPKFQKALRAPRAKPDRAVPDQYANRPPAVRKLIELTWRESDRLRVGSTFLRILHAIISTGFQPEKPHSPIFTRRSTLARHAGCSERSVHRYLADARDRGWIRITQQPLNQDKTFGCAEIVLQLRFFQDLGCQSLAGIKQDKELPKKNNGLVGAGKTKDSGQRAQPAQEVDVPAPPPASSNTTASRSCTCLPSNRSAKAIPLRRSNGCNAAATSTGPALASGLANGLASGPNKGEQGVHPGVIGKPKQSPNSPVDNRPHEFQAEAVGAPTSPEAELSPPARLEGGFVTVDGRRIPSDLLWLHEEKQLPSRHIVSLMKLAIENKKLLSEVVAYRSVRIGQLESARDCYLYLRAVIKTDLDVGYLLAQRHKRDALKSQAMQKSESIERRRDWANSHAGEVYGDGDTEITIRPGGHVQATRNGLPTGRLELISDRTIQNIESGQLCRRHIDVMTRLADDERRFQQARAAYQRHHAALAKKRPANGQLAPAA